MSLRALAKLLFWGCAGFVFVLSVLPTEDLPPVEIWDKASHAIAYGALMLLCGIGYRACLPLWKMALLLFAYGVAIEIVQSLLPGRQFSLLDMVANGIGLLAALPLVNLAEKILRIESPRQ